MKFFILHFLGIGLTIAISLNAQAQSIKGNIKGSTLKPESDMPLPNVTIKLLKDSELVKVGISDSSGNYFLNNLKNGQYELQFSFLGYQIKSVIINLKHDTTINISLSPTTKQISEVQVTAQKPLIERKIDRVVFNVGSSVLSKGVNAIDVLRETPRIEVNGNNDIKMLGKSNLRIMINGRILNLSDEDVKNKLKSLRSDDISSIEVIPTPPANYSAEGNSGLINIVLKKNPLQGWKGSANLEYIQRIYPSYSQSANINFQSAKIEASLGLSNNHSNNVNKSIISYDFFTEKAGLNTMNYTNFISNSQSLSSVLKYKISKRYEVGVTFDYSYRPNHNNDRGYNAYTSGDKNKVLDSIVNSISTYKDTSKAAALSTYFDYNIDSLGKKLSITYNYSLNSNSSLKLINSYISASDLNEKNIIFTNYGDNAYKINSIMMDFELPYRFVKVEAGGAYSFINNNTSLKLFNNGSNQTILDSSSSNDFEYSEKTGAAYISAQGDFNKKWSGKAGLRYEYTSLEGFSPTLNLKNSRNYGKLFPSVFVLYKLNDSISLSLTYSKRIERPRFYDLNPFRYYSSVYSYISGNAYLLPSLSHNIELSFLYKNSLSIILSGSRSLSNIGYISLFSQGINSLIPENCYNQNRLGIDISYTYKPYKWCDIYSSGNVYYNKSKSYVDALQIPDVEGYGASVGTRSTFTLNERKTTFFSLRYMQFFPSQNGLNKTKSFGYASANFRFNALKNNLTFLISSVDIFKQNHTVTQMKYLNYNTQQIFDPKGQNILVSVTYNFGNNSVKNVSRESKNEERQRAF